MKYLNGLSLKYKKELNEVISEEPSVVQNNNEPKVVTNVKKSKTSAKKKIALFLVAAGLVAGIHGSINNGEKEPTYYEKPAISYEQESEIDTESNFELEEPLKEEVSESKLKLGDSVTLIDSSLIYSDSYKADLMVEGHVRYYQENLNREVYGLTYNLNGELTTVYQHESLADEKIAKLEAEGAYISSVLISNEYGIEGYISINDIQKNVEMGLLK